MREREAIVPGDVGKLPGESGPASDSSMFMTLDMDRDCAERRLRKAASTVEMIAAAVPPQLLPSEQPGIAEQPNGEFSPGRSGALW